MIHLLNQVREKSRAAAPFNGGASRLVPLGVSEIIQLIEEDGKVEQEKNGRCGSIFCNDLSTLGQRERDAAGFPGRPLRLSHSAKYDAPLRITRMPKLVALTFYQKSIE
jgi:hypothetical protein